VNGAGSSVQAPQEKADPLCQVGHSVPDELEDELLEDELELDELLDELLEDELELLDELPLELEPDELEVEPPPPPTPPKPATPPQAPAPPPPCWYPPVPAVPPLPAPPPIPALPPEFSVPPPEDALDVPPLPPLELPAAPHSDTQVELDFDALSVQLAARMRVDVANTANPFSISVFTFFSGYFGKSFYF